MWNKIKKAGLLFRHIAGYNPGHHARHDYHYKFISVKEDLNSVWKNPLHDTHILIYGCGYHYPEVALFSTESEHVEGIDTAEAFHRDSLFSISSDLLRSDGGNPFFAPVKAWLKKYHYYQRYYRQMEKITGTHFDHSKYILTSYDGSHLPYERDSFDLIISNSVLEHVQDLKNGFSEMNRVTKQGGFTYHLWHNFYSYSGGHAPVSVMNKHPWGHIIGEYNTPVLNKLTPDEIRSFMSPYFEEIAFFGIDRSYLKQGIDTDFEFEQEALFTDPLRSRMPDLPREWFLTTAYLIVGRKKN